MTRPETRKAFSRFTAAAGIGLPLLWLALHAHRITGSPDGIIRLVLGVLFGGLILSRKRRDGNGAPAPSPAAGNAALGLAGTGAALLGLLIPIGTLEWLGVILLAYACLRASLSARYRSNLPWAMAMLFAAAPFPHAWLSAVQAGMQQASTQGAERLLHMFNTRVWADGMILRTGTGLYEVPAWCSGMRTATTVLMLAIGLGALRRMRPAGMVVLAAGSLATALLLNILRIAAMIGLAPAMTGTGTSDAFLHDTAGLVLIGGVLLVYVELMILEHLRFRRRQWRQTLPAAREGGLSEYPPFWHRLRQWRGRIAILTVVCVLGGALAWRSRPAHRAAMLRDTAMIMLEHGDRDGASRLSEKLSREGMDDPAWRLYRIRLDLLSGRPHAALALLDTLPAEAEASDPYAPPLLRARALALLNRPDESAVAESRIPADIRRTHPQVAMIMAETAFLRNDAASVAAYLPVAARYPPHTDRIRRLYPFLCRQGQWHAIADTDPPDVPYPDPETAFAALEAHIRLHRPARVAKLALTLEENHPRDPRLMTALMMLAHHDRETWGPRADTHLRSIIPSAASPDALYDLMDSCFRRVRPDLAWRVYDRLQREYPDHPLTALAVAQSGHLWFRFRQHDLGLPSDDPNATLDIRPFYILSRRVPIWGDARMHVPLGDALGVTDPQPERKAFLQRALDGFAEKRRRDGLSPTLSLHEAQALALAGRLDLARDRLKSLSASFPDHAAAARDQLARLFADKGAWVQVYEILRHALLAEPSPAIPPTWPPVPIALNAGLDIPSASTLVRLIEAQDRLDLPLAADFTAREAMRRYPHDPRPRARLASLYLRKGDPEMALHLLGKSRIYGLAEMADLEAQALMDTGRFSAIEAFRRQHRLPPVRIPPGTEQDDTFPPAEYALWIHHLDMPDEGQWQAAAGILRRNLAGAGAGLRPLLPLWLDAGEQDCQGDLADPARWLAEGRDRVEQGIALHQLTLMLCRNGRPEEALIAARLAVAAMPASPRLWQWLISLEGGRFPETLTLARRHHPGDPGIWLADLVARTRFADAPSGIPPEATDIGPLIEQALEHDPIPISTVARAADYLLRGGRHRDAARLAGARIQDARHLLPACMSALDIALTVSDRQLALQATEYAIEASLNPSPMLYTVQLMLRSGADRPLASDTVRVNALHNLRRQEPDQSLWPQMLGYARFQQGGTTLIESLLDMQDAIALGATNQTPFLVAAEVLRQLRHPDQAETLLRQALRHHPGSIAVINNLAFTLAGDDDRAEDAAEFLPELIAAAEGDPRVRDTLSRVYLRRGQLEYAHATINRQIEDTAPGSPAWFRAHMHLAELAWRQGHDQAAINLLEKLLRGSRNIPDTDILEANALFTRITRDLPSDGSR